MFKTKLLILLVVLQSFVYSQSGWYQQNSGTQNPLLSVFFVNSETGFVCGGWGCFLKTTNGGNNWNRYFIDTVTQCRSMYFFDSNRGYMIGDNIIFNTSNGGLNWNQVSTINGYGLMKILFINEQMGFITTTYGTILKTTNNGLNWQMLQVVPNILLRDIFFTDNQTGYTVGYSSNVYKTTNQGLNWSGYYSGIIGAYTSVYFTDVNTGFVVGYYGKSVKTTNGGLTWEVMNLNTNQTLFSIKFINNTTGFICGSNIILKTVNAGNNWSLNLFDTANSIPLYDMQFTNESTGYAVGHKIFGYPFGIILKTTTGGEPIGIQPISNQIPDYFSLSQNYPNPFNPNTSIKFSIPKSSFVNITIYNMLGEEVVILVNQELKPGTYEADFDGSNLPSGTYFYRLQAGNYTETKKMVLLK